MDSNICQFCQKEIEEDFNFCPYCGEPLSNLAKTIRAKQERNAQLQLALSLIDSVRDEDTLSLIQEFVKDVKEKM